LKKSSSDTANADALGPIPGDDEMLFLPLGGTGEIGMNLNLYGHAGRWLMIDCGITFGNDTTPGVDVIMPNPSFIEERRDRLCGIVLTHAHEDHIGAVPYLWRRLQCPIYATPFTAALLRRKLEDEGLARTAKITEIALSGKFSVGPFDLELITVTHSIPEPNAVVLRTPVGTVLHTGDWKLDPDPRVGESADEAALRRVGEEGVLAMIGDSTNAQVDGRAGSEGAVGESLTKLIGELENRVVVACFASNIARIRMIAEAAKANGRAVGLVGRSMWRNTEVARDTGYMKGLPNFLSEDDAARLPRDKVLLICTGSQGEARAALSRIARDDHPRISLNRGDTVIFSSRIIPGNEVSIGHLQNQLAMSGLHLITERDRFVHVSGHPARDELEQMYRWIRPQIAIPVHGETRHLIAHAELARSCEVPHVAVIANGDIVRLAKDGPETIGQAQTGRLTREGSDLIALEDDNIRDRARILWNGSVTVTVVVDSDGHLLHEPQLSAPGVIADSDDDIDFENDILDDVVAAVHELGDRDARSDDTVIETVRRVVRRAVRDRRGKRPLIDVHLVRL
jgi:ribonuclease J